MELEKKPKFKFTSHAPAKEKENKMKEKEKLTIDELKQYYNIFIAEYKKIEDKLNNFKIEENRSESQKEEDNNSLEIITSEIAKLKEDYLVNAYLLVAYDKQSYLNMLENLSATNSKLKEKANPRKKFAFTKKATNKSESSLSTSESIRSESPSINSNCSTGNILQRDENVFAAGKVNATIPQSSSSTTLPVKRNSEDYFMAKIREIKILVKPSEVEGKNNLIIDDAENCEIYLPYSFKACYLKNIKKCKIYVGAVAGGSHITNLTDSEIFLATHQLRIHDTYSSNFNVLVMSNPIIENCSQLIFQNMNITFTGQDQIFEDSGIKKEKNKWNNVMDFKWHKKEKSPNFDLKLDEESSGVTNIDSLLEGYSRLN